MTQRSSKSLWWVIRTSLVVLGAIVSFFVPLGPQAKPPIDWFALLLIFASCPIALVFVLGIQVMNPMSSRVWRRPSWSANPFNFSEPLQFFHFGAYAMLVQGTVLLIRLAASPVPFYVEVLIPMTMGLGVLLGIQLTMLVFRRKMRALPE
jgi:hypothetical protein